MEMGINEAHTARCLARGEQGTFIGVEVALLDHSGQPA